MIAAIPYFDCRPYIRRAVEGLLAQTHRELTVVVVNDGDPQPPWPLLADITDRRLVRFSLRRNHGPYFAAAVVLAAASAPYFLIQDADDWSAPDRAASLLTRLEEDGSDFAVSAQSMWTKDGRPVGGVLWSSAAAGPETTGHCVIRPALTARFLYRAPHHGLFRADALRRIGGYYGGFRISYDTLITNLMFMTGKVSHLPQPLYCRTHRPESLSLNAETGYRSAMRFRINLLIAQVYRDCFRHYVDYKSGRIDSARFLGVIRSRLARTITTSDARELTIETARLKRLLACAASGGGR